MLTEVNLKLTENDWKKNTDADTDGNLLHALWIRLHDVQMLCHTAVAVQYS